ncbi:C1 family peptidase [Paramuribaculum intestinale]|uniref:C1 family peptidase n=1 Tax=Paramuribaculum intestinale TaxID=2094151 RepID=UPI0026754C95|nr:C1 family peptidase [Paramuribaculum intestinale]
MRRISSLMAAIILGGFCAMAQQASGGISPEMMTTIKSAYKNTPADRAIRNAITANDINSLARNLDARRPVSSEFSHRVPSKGITNQRSSGRCWLFTGLNVLRAQMMTEHDLPMTELSQNYNFFFDQLEKANLFLQGVIDTSDRPMDDKTVDWLFRNPLSDGGQFTGIADIVGKYGVVPAEVMPETNSSNSTSRLNQLLSLKLREWGLELRDAAKAKTKATELGRRKTEMLGEVYRMLVLNLGEPPTEFTWTRRNSKGEAVDTMTYTPLSFYDRFLGNNLSDDYVMLMNDPTRPYYNLYEIEYDRHAYDGRNWTYVNLPMEDIKEMAIASIKDSTAMYFSCDVGKFLDRERGVLDPDFYDYGSLLGTTFGMDKRQRVLTHASGSSHAMTLVAVDLDKEGKPVKWLVENSWGPGANGGHLIITDRWMDEYMFRLVVDKKYLTPKARAVMSKKAELLPPWDPMFAPED